MITQEVMQIPEVAAYKSEVRIVYDVPFGIFILVETKQSSTVSQASPVQRATWPEGMDAGKATGVAPVASRIYSPFGR